MRREVTVVDTRAVSNVRRGHPWVFKESVVSMPSKVGTFSDVTDRSGALLGSGLVDPGSPIAVRMFAHDRVDFGALLTQRMSEAFARRRDRFENSATTAFRLIHGEGDRLPGFVVDRYESVAVLKTDGDAATSRANEFAEILWPLLGSFGIETLVTRSTGGTASTLVKGKETPDRIRAREHGVPFFVDVLTGQKTGAFLDQRENRRKVGTMAHGKRVLNLFSYAGGFSVHAALGGATKVTSVDIAMNAHATAQATFRENKIDTKLHDFVTADAFQFLDKARAEKREWDLIICDPPSFAPNERSKPRALQAYRKLHHACAQVLAKSGIFCAASCSSHVDAKTFMDTLDDESLGRGDLSVQEVLGPPVDHPVLAAFPEGMYLKFVVLS